MVASRKSKSGSEAQFPGKLHDMMKFVEDNALESIISWECNGYGVKINNPERLVEILPLFFGQTKYRSFRRQLNMWHFQRILDGPNKGTFVHPYFVKHDRALCAQMSRQLSFTPTPLQKERIDVVLTSCIEPDPIRETVLDTKLSPNIYDSVDFAVRDIHPSISTAQCSGSAEFFQLSDCSLPSTIQNSIPALPGQTTKTFDAALKELENIIANDDQHKMNNFNECLMTPLNTQQQYWHDGDLVSFEGKKFFFLESPSL
jgi:hypothetical protein